MTAIEHRELKGITLKNLVVTIASTASIVASVMTTYFGLKSEIQEVRNSQETQTRINALRLKILENQVNLLQFEMDRIKLSGTKNSTGAKNVSSKKADQILLSSVEKK